jgi:hypothetical protein
MPQSNIVRTLRDGQIVITNGTVSFTLDKEVGDFAFEVPIVEPQLFLDRNEITATPDVRKGADQPMTGSFSAHFRDPGSPSAAYATLLDICVRVVGDYAATSMTSTLSATSDLPTYSIAYTVIGTTFSESDKTLTFPFAFLTASFAEGDPNTINVSWTSYATKYTLA